MFEGFEETLIETEGTRLFVRHGGSGVPIVLLHGHPRTSATWHLVAPLLASAGHTVICPDLPGYGRSELRDPQPDHTSSSKRSMSRDILTALESLGHTHFHLLGHDRGSYAALRLALDRPDAVGSVTLADCLPISEHLARTNAAFATAWWHWFFFAQPDKPEQAILADPLAWYRLDEKRMGSENFAETSAAVSRRDVVSGMLADYRAGLTIDSADEKADRRAGRKLDVPALILWSTRDDIEQLYGDPLEIWRSWATDVRGARIESGHHMAEEAPEQLAAELLRFVG